MQVRAIHASERALIDSYVDAAHSLFQSMYREVLREHGDREDVLVAFQKKLGDTCRDSAKLRATLRDLHEVRADVIKFARTLGYADVVTEDDAHAFADMATIQAARELWRKPQIMYHKCSKNLQASHRSMFDAFCKSVAKSALKDMDAFWKQRLFAKGGEPTAQPTAAEDHETVDVLKINDAQDEDSDHEHGTMDSKQDAEDIEEDEDDAEAIGGDRAEGTQCTEEDEDCAEGTEAIEKDEDEPVVLSDIASSVLATEDRQSDEKIILIDEASAADSGQQMTKDEDDTVMVIKHDAVEDTDSEDLNPLTISEEPKHTTSELKSRVKNKVAKSRLKDRFF